MAKLRITYTKSSIGYSKDQKETVRSLGLRKLNSTVIQEDTPSIRGMIFKVKHLVRVEELGNNTPTAVESASGRAAKPAAKPAVTPSPIVTSAAPAMSDDLEVIEGIGPKIAGVLLASGISTFAQLAAADTAHLTEILQAANLRLASPESWPEQAELAAAGDWDGLKQLQDQLKAGRRA